MYGLAIPKLAPDQLLSFTATTLLANAVSEASIATTLGSTLSLMPVRRDVLAKKPADDPYLGFFYDAALVQRPWLDPNPVKSGQIFSTLISDISSSTLGTADALSKASAQLQAITTTI
jgi:hypothetical protein